MTRLLQKNPAFHVMGVSMSNIVVKASSEFTKVSLIYRLKIAFCSIMRTLLKVTQFDIEDLMLDIYYYFEKSSKRKNELFEFCVFCDTEYKTVLKHITTRC